MDGPTVDLTLQPDDGTPQAASARIANSIQCFLFWLKRVFWMKPKWFIIRHTRCRIFGHEIGDTGYDGSNKRDVWCRHCDKFDQIDIAEAGWY